MAIFTDSYENSSFEFSRKEINRLITRQREFYS